MEKISEGLNEIRSKANSSISSFLMEVHNQVTNFSLRDEQSKFKLAFAVSAGLSGFLICRHVWKRIKGTTRTERSDSEHSATASQGSVGEEIIKRGRRVGLNAEFAEYRKRVIGYVDYINLFVLNDGGIDRYSGVTTINFELRRIDQTKPFFIDLEVQEITKFYINRRFIVDINAHWHDSKLTIPFEFLNEGNNQIEIHFKNNYREMGAGLISIIDTSNEQYIYTMTKPYCAHLIYPCFDQPDLKGLYKFYILAPEKWKIVSYEMPLSASMVNQGMGNEIKKFVKEFLSETPGYELTTLPTSCQMNTVCAGFVAGNFDELEIPTDDVYKFKHMNIFCRKSQIEKCQKVGFDLKEIISKAMKFLDTYFDNTINVNKFNLIFLPFTKYPALELATCPIINEEWLFSYENDFLFEIKRGALIIQQLIKFWLGFTINISWWNECWLNESLSLYLSYLSLSKITKKLDPNSILYGVDTVWEIFSFQKECYIITDFFKYSQGVVIKSKYSNDIIHFLDPKFQWRGAAIWKQLAYLVGDELFRKGLNKIFQAHQNFPMSIKSFMDKLDETLKDSTSSMLTQSIDSFIMVSSFDIGSFNLVEWVNDWIIAPGLNEVEVVWDSEDNRISNLIKIRQANNSPNGNLRHHRIKLTLVNSRGEVFKVKDIYLLKQEFTTVLLEDPEKIPSALIINYECESYLKTFMDPTSFNFLFSSLSKIKENKVIIAVLVNAFNQVIRGKLSASKLITVITTFLIERKTTIDPTILQIILSMSQYTIEELASKQASSHMKSLLYNSLLDLAKNIDKGFMIRPIVINNLPNFAENPEDCELLVYFFNEYLSDNENYSKTPFEVLFKFYKQVYLSTKNLDYFNKFSGLKEIIADDILAKYYKTQFSAILKPDFGKIRQYFSEKDADLMILAAFKGSRHALVEFPLEAWNEIAIEILKNNDDYDARIFDILVPRNAPVEGLLDILRKIKTTNPEDSMEIMWSRHFIQLLEFKKNIRTNP